VPAVIAHLKRTVATAYAGGRSGAQNTRGDEFHTVRKREPAELQKPLNPLNPPRSSYCSLKMGNHSRHKGTYLLPTRSRCLDRLCSLSLFTGSVQDLQRPYLHGVPHNNANTGRYCWHGRNSLFSAEIPPMRFTRDVPRDWKISQRVLSSSLPPLAVAPGGEVSGRANYVKRPSPLGVPSRQADVQIVEATASTSYTLPRVHTVLDVTYTGHPSMSAGQELSGHLRDLANPILRLRVGCG
jgi:hypothetical protein